MIVAEDGSTDGTKGLSRRRQDQGGSISFASFKKAFEDLRESANWSQKTVRILRLQNINSPFHRDCTA
jgi:hypothetical protein